MLVKKQKFSLGEKVFLVHLKEEGTIRRWSGSDLLYVEVDGMVIPVFSSDVQKIIPGMTRLPDEKEMEKKEEERRRSEAERTNKGIFIAFEPLKNPSGDIASFNIYLINDTQEATDFSWYFFLGSQIHFVLKKVLKPYDYLLIHTIEYDLLNEGPSVQLEIRDVKNEIFKGKLDQKIKPQNFFNKLTVVPLFQKEAYSYVVPLTYRQEKKTEKPQPVAFDPDVLRHLMTETTPVKDKDIEMAEQEIDLHIETLTSEHRSMDNAEMLQLQLKRFQQSLERAISHRLPKFYAIHGVGSGRLKKEIHRLLRQYKEVKSFNNDYHPRYGFGATEVILQ